MWWYQWRKISFCFLRTMKRVSPINTIMEVSKEERWKFEESMGRGRNTEKREMNEETATGRKRISLPLPHSKWLAVIQGAPKLEKD